MTADKDVQFKSGAIVYLHRPTSVLKKITCQWSDTMYVVVSVSSNTCVVRHLGGKAPKLSQIIKDNSLSELIINKKKMSPYQLDTDSGVLCGGRSNQAVRQPMVYRTC